MMKNTRKLTNDCQKKSKTFSHIFLFRILRRVVKLPFSLKFNSPWFQVKYSSIWAIEEGLTVLCFSIFHLLFPCFAFLFCTSKHRGMKSKRRLVGSWYSTCHWRTLQVMLSCLSKLQNKTRLTYIWSST